MLVKLLGIESISYNKKSTGELVSAVNLHCSYPDVHVNGDKCQSVFVSDSLGFRTLINTFSPGMDIILDFAPNGQLYQLYQFSPACVNNPFLDGAKNPSPDGAKNPSPDGAKK